MDKQIETIVNTLGMRIANLEVERAMLLARIQELEQEQVETEVNEQLDKDGTKNG